MTDRIRERVFAINGFQFPGSMAERAFNGVSVRLANGAAELGFGTKVQKARAYFLLMQQCMAGKTAFEITETPRFETVGPMLDLSRGRVLRVDAVKRLIDCFAALGFNMLMLYTEDIYELEGYPFFGYLRGRYSMKELREIDDYANEMGVEVIPCIQTFGHLEKFLRWKDSAPADTDRVLLAGDEGTYTFIEKELRTMRAAFRSRRIHLGMDETKNMGLGKYLHLHGYQKPLDIYFAHLRRVLDIARHYFDGCMIWSDMLFDSPLGGDYNIKYTVPQEVVDAAPRDVQLVYWDYYRENYEYYYEVLKRHARFANETAFAGGVWTWDGFEPNFDYTFKTMIPAMKACLDHGVKTVIATAWVSGGCGADYFHALPGFAVFSEYCYKGNACTEADIYAAATALGADETLLHAISAPYLGERGATGFGKSLFYCDPLINLLHHDIDLPAAAAAIRAAQAEIAAHTAYCYRDFYLALLDCTAGKAELLAEVRRAYDAGDRAALGALASEKLPALICSYERFHRLFAAGWRENYKTFGFERYSCDIGGVVQRLKDAMDIIRRYLNGEIECIEELDEKILPGINKRWTAPRDHMVTS